MNHLKKIIIMSLLSIPLVVSAQSLRPGGPGGHGGNSGLKDYYLNWLNTGCQPNDVKCAANIVIEAIFAAANSRPAPGPSPYPQSYPQVPVPQTNEPITLIFYSQNPYTGNGCSEIGSNLNDREVARLNLFKASPTYNLYMCEQLSASVGKVNVSGVYVPDRNSATGRCQNFPQADILARCKSLALGL